MKNYYQILGVKKDASEETIREQWIEWMRKLHPDQHTVREGEDQKIKEINEAYQVLKHSSTRMEYDLKLAYSHKEKRSYSLKWSIPAVMMAVILVTTAVYVRRPKSTIQSPLRAVTHTTEDRTQNLEVINQSNKISERDHRNQRDQNSEVGILKSLTNYQQITDPPSAEGRVSSQQAALSSQQPEFKSQETEVRIQKSVISSQQSEVSNPKDGTDQTDPIDQGNQTNPSDVDSPQSPKIIMVSATEGDPVIQIAQSSPEPSAPPTQRRLDPSTRDRVSPSTLERVSPPVQKRVEPSPRPPVPPPTPRLIATEEEVKEFFNNYVERYNQKDLEGFFSLFSKKATQNRQSKVEDIRKVYSDFFNQSQRIRYYLFDTRTEIYQNALEVKARYELVQTLKQGGEKIWRGTIRWTLVRENGALRILSLEYQPQKSL